MDTIKYWTIAEIEFARANAHLGEPALAAHFGIDQKKVRAMLRNHRIRTGNNTKFKAGHISWNTVELGTPEKLQQWMKDKGLVPGTCEEYDSYFFQNCREMDAKRAIKNEDRQRQFELKNNPLTK